MVGSGGVGASEGLWSLTLAAVELIEMNSLALTGGNSVNRGRLGKWFL